MDDREKTLRIRNGQSTLEYVIILAVVVGAIIGIAVIAKPNFASTYNMIYGNTPNPAGYIIPPGSNAPSGGGGSPQHQAI